MLEKVYIEMKKVGNISIMLGIINILTGICCVLSAMRLLFYKDKLMF